MSEIDVYMPDEDQVEVLIGMVSTWSEIEANILYPALETVFEDASPLLRTARERLDALYALQYNIHEGENAEAPFDDLVKKYIDAVKYHIVVDVQDIIPLTSQLPHAIGLELLRSMEALKYERE